MASTTTTPTCPAFPNPTAVPVKDILASPPVKAAFARVDALLANASSRLPSGLVATVVLGQETVWSKGYGLRNVRNPAEGPPRTTDLVRIASITKVFTTLLLFELRDQGAVHLGDPLTRWLSDFSIQVAGWDTREVPAITLDALASHTSGLPREVPYPCASFHTFPGCNETQVLAALQQKYATLPPHTRFHYSNLGMALLGRALGHASVLDHRDDDDDDDPLDMAYERAVSRLIFAPLGMANATFAYNATTAARAAVGTDTSGKPVEMQDGPTCGWSAPAGCIWASAEDMARLMKLVFRASVPAAPPTQMVDGATLSEMLLPRVLLRDGFEAVGVPWEMQFEPAVGWLKGKQGELPGFRSSVTVSEDLQLGVFTSALVTDVDEHTVWTVPVLKILGPAIKEAMQKLAPLPQLPPGYERYLGSYYDGTVVVELVGSELVLRGLGYGNKSGPLVSATAGLVLRAVDDAHPNLLRAHPSDLDGIGCRWLDDGVDQELVQFYFDGQEPAQSAIALEFMGFRGARRK